jgi:hypothetical protein
LATALLVVASDAAMAAVYRASPDSYRSLIGRLRAGDTLDLVAGEYRDGLPLHNLSGGPGRPITISGPERGTPATFIARPGRNTVSIVASRYLVIRKLVLEGNDLPVDAVKAEGHSSWAHDITLEDLIIRGHGSNQQTVGISTKCPAWNWVIRRNSVIGAGTGMYLGNSDGSAPFVAGLIEHNLIVDTVGYNLQIKHQLSRPVGVGLPEGRSMTIIRHNVFAKTNPGSAEAPRPNVLVGHLPRDGPGAEDDYAIYGNFFYQNRNEALFQGEGNIALYGNLFVNEHGDAMRIQPHNGIPRRVVVAFNTVVASGAGVSVLQKEGALHFQQRVIANAVFAGVPLSGGEQTGNVAAPMEAAARFLTRPFAPLGELDLRPRSGAARIALPDVDPGASLQDWTRDFDGRPRARGDIGAYTFSGVKPAWVPRLEIKPEPQYCVARCGSAPAAATPAQ